MCRRGRCRLQAQADRLGNLIIADLPRRAAAGLVIEPVEPSRGEAPAPFADGVLVGADNLGNDLVVHPGRGREHDPGAAVLARFAAGSPGFPIRPALLLSTRLQPPPCPSIIRHPPAE